MDIECLAQPVIDLRLANECEAAAEMDVEDQRARVLFHERKLAAMMDLLSERKQAAQEAGDKLAHIVNAMTTAPLMLMMEAEERNDG